MRQRKHVLRVKWHGICCFLKAEGTNEPQSAIKQKRKTDISKYKINIFKIVHAFRLFQPFDTVLKWVYSWQSLSIHLLFLLFTGLGFSHLLWFHHFVTQTASIPLRPTPSFSNLPCFCFMPFSFPPPAVSGFHLSSQKVFIWAFK